MVMMEDLKNDIEKVLDTSNFSRIGDLTFSEGPLLTLFSDFSNDYLFLFDWVDRDDQTNRWLIYRITPDGLQSFLNQEISHLQLFGPDRSEDVYFTDIVSRNKPYYHYTAYQLVEVPDIYLPVGDVIFDQSDSRGLRRINSSLSKLLGERMQSSI